MAREVLMESSQNKEKKGSSTFRVGKNSMT